MGYKPEKDNVLIQNLTFDYALYIMLTSYFKKSTCNSTQIITRLKLNYAEVGVNAQYEAEDIVIDKLENNILLRKDFEGIDKYDVDVSFSFLEDEKRNIITISFNNKKYNIKIVPRFNKEEKKLEASIIVKEASC